MELNGVVIKSTGRWYTVRGQSGEQVMCSLKGNFRMRGLKTTNPVAVGDRVVCRLDDNGRMGLIESVLERKNCIIRKATNLSKVSHLVASNIDRALLVVTIAFPETPLGFIDRFLVSAEAYHVPVTVLINKSDLWQSDLAQKADNFMKLYRSVGYDCLKVSAVSGEGVEELKRLMSGQVNLFSGVSGVGKSTLINVLQPGINLSTGPISEYHLKGRHITTFAEMHALDFGADIIDTPGLREFGLIDVAREEISHFFPEMYRLISRCQFHNCTHTHEPRCAVILAVQAGQIPQSRYKNYLNMFNSENN